MRFTICLLLLAVGAHARPPERSTVQPIQLEDMIKGKYVPKGFNGTWISESAFVYKSQRGDLEVFDVKKKSKTILVDVDDVRWALTHGNDKRCGNANITSKYNDELKVHKLCRCKQNKYMRDFNITSFTLSPTLDYVLIYRDAKQCFRYSSIFRCFMFSIKTKDITELSRDMFVQHASWVPETNSLVYVRDNNVYYRKGPIRGDRELQLTTDGVPGVRYNGVTDWVYEEEIFSSGSALWCSPDGEQIAIATFDDSNVDKEIYLNYGETANMDTQYPKLEQLRYPKPGRMNPVVKVKVLRFSEAVGRSIHWKPISAPVALVGSDHILADVTWATKTEVAITWLNRRQNLAVMQICHADTGVCKTELKTEEKRGWIEAKSPWFYPEGKHYIAMQSVTQMDGSSWPHLVGAARGIEPTPITSGNFTVLSILGVDPIRDHIFYVSTSPDSPSHREVSVTGSKSFCLTRMLRNDDGSTCRYGCASFSKDYSYAVVACSGPDPPTIVIYDIDKDKIMMTWEDNRQLREDLTKVSQSEILDLMVDVPRGFQAQVRLHLPPCFDETKKYPMINGVYAGPNSKKIVDVYFMGYYKYLITTKEFIYCEIDGRGSGYRGNDLLFQITNVLGTVEIDDQISVTRKLTDMYDFIDPQKIGLWGWSYGGYASAMTMVRDKGNVFRCGISVAPVLSWYYYDSIFTERYMGFPADNPEGYKESDVTLHPEGFRNKGGFLLLHGSADDNVHYENSMQLVRQLQKNNISFEAQSYPNENHDMISVRPHIYHTINRFWATCLNLE